MPEWLQEILALTTVALAAVWLVLRWVRIGQPRAPQPGCARCEHNPIAAVPNRPGVRSSRLRVLR